VGLARSYTARVTSALPLLHAGSADSPFLSWSFEPLQLLPPLAIGVLYALRVDNLRRRGHAVAAWRVWCFAAGIGLIVLALASPIHAYGEEEFFFVHMVQHVLLGDLAALAIVAGLTGQILRPVLALPGVRHAQVLAHPLIALPLWAVNLIVWHLPALYGAALEHPPVHALQHFLFFTTGALMWAAVVETLPAPVWFGTGAKLGYIVVVRLVETVVANVFLWSGTVFYDRYDGKSHWGISPLHDQALAGTVMMLEGGIVTLAALAWLFLKLASEGELRQELLERGLDPRQVQRAVRYGRADQLGQEDPTPRGI
jgi:putative membrane protein